MRNVTVTFDDGSQHLYQGVPDDVAPDAIEARASQEFSKKVTGLDGGAAPQGGAQFHPSMPDGYGAPGLTEGLKAAGELALSGATHAVSGPLASGIAGLAARFTGHDPDAWKAAAENAATYNTPENSVARAYTDKFSGMVSGARQSIDSLAPGIPSLGQEVHNADDFIGKYGGPEAQRIARQTVGTAGDLLNAAPLLGAGAKAVSTIASAARPVEEAATVARTPDELARAADIRVPPSIMAATTGAAKPGMAQRAGESLGGSSEMAREDIIHNKGRVNSLGAQAANLPEDTLLSPAALDKADAPHAAVYRQVEAAIPESVAIDDTTKAAIARAGERPNSLRPTPVTVDKAREGALAIDQANGTQLKATIADYRDKGYAALRSDDVDQQAFGRAQLDIANALEDQMERQLDTTNPGLADQFRQARQGFAVNSTIREALVGHDLDPKVVLKLADANRGISGPLKLIADLTERFPQVMTVKVPRITAGSVINRGAHYGVPGLIGFAAGGPVGAAAGIVGSHFAQKGIRALTDLARSGSGDSRVALGTALADYVRQQGGAFPDSLTGFKVPGKRGGVVATVPGRDYSLPDQPTRMGAEVSTPHPADAALADAIASRHMGSPNSRLPLRLPAPGQLAMPNVEAHGIRARRAALGHPANPILDSSAMGRFHGNAASKRERMKHIADVLEGRARLSGE